MTDCRLILGDCVEKMKELPENSVDSIACDPPYGLNFMGKGWDSSGVAFRPEAWREALRVLKPGAHLLAFGGTRTYHRLACAIEDAGFEVRDCVFWLYGSGFPKSHNVSKAIDKMKGAEREVVAPNPNERPNCSPQDNTLYEYGSTGKTGGITAPATPEAKAWEGWGTALKPACEPIVVARKPLGENTVAENVLKYGTGAMNIDASRIGHNEETKTTVRKQRSAGWNPDNCGFDSTQNTVASAAPQGRFPANVILDEEAAKELDRQSGDCAQGHWSKSKVTGFGEFGGGTSEHFGVGEKDTSRHGASRFFYVAKASRAEREEGLRWDEHDVQDTGTGALPSPVISKRSRNTHPTVKPVALMEYLVRLITPPQGVVLDPFMGSGTTGIAAQKLGFRFIGIELQEDYLKIAQARIATWEGQQRLGGV